MEPHSQHKKTNVHSLQSETGDEEKIRFSHGLSVVAGVRKSVQPHRKHNHVSKHNWLTQVLSEQRLSNCWYGRPWLKADLNLKLQISNSSTSAENFLSPTSQHQGEISLPWVNLDPI